MYKISSVNKKSRVLNEALSQSYRVSLAIQDHTVLPATRH